MFTDIINALGAAIVTVIGTTGYFGIAALMAIESMCIPLPSELIMPFAGYLVSTGQLSLIWVATAGAVGCNIGSTIAYYIGARGGRPAVERWGKYVLLDQKDLVRAQAFFERFGSLAVFIGRLLPVVRTFIALPAGFARMDMIKFQVFSFVGSWIWCWLLAYIGAQLGAQWDANPSLRTALHGADAVIVIAGLAAIGWFVYRRVRHAR